MKHGIELCKGGLEHVADLCLLTRKQKQLQLLATKNMAVVSLCPYLLACFDLL
jgi:hypothetical protein